MSKALDLTGDRFGRLIVTGVAPSVKGKGMMYCLCDCGSVVTAGTGHLRNGHTKSCGCYGKEQLAAGRTTHGGSKTRLYRTWSDIKTRCYNSKIKSFADYGGRGITVCDRWLESFENFAFDMGEKPFPGAQIDRIRNNEGYSPDNCKWSDKKEQMRNKRDNVLITYNGQTRCLPEWAEIIGISQQILRRRIRKLGWTPERAFTEAIRAW